QPTNATLPAVTTQVAAPAPAQSQEVRSAPGALPAETWPAPRHESVPAPPPAVVAVPASPPPVVMSVPSIGQAQAAQPPAPEPVRIVTPPAPDPQEAVARSAATPTPTPTPAPDVPPASSFPIRADTKAIVSIIIWVELSDL